MRRSPGSALAPVAWLALAACGGAPRGPTAPVCPADRVVVLAGQDDVARFAGCTGARGVVIRTGAALDLAPLGALEAIAGDLVIGPSVGLEQVTLSGLRSVGGAVRVATNGNLAGLALPVLTRAGRLDVAGNVALTTVVLARLAAVTGALAFTDNPALELIELSSLTAVGGELVLAGQPELVLVETGALAAVPAVRLDRLPKLPAETADRLRALARR